MPANFIPVKSQRRPSEPIGSRESKREKPNESKYIDVSDGSCRQLILVKNVTNILKLSL